jgi:hypothetical protein
MNIQQANIFYLPQCWFWILGSSLHLLTTIQLNPVGDDVHLEFYSSAIFFLQKNQLSEGTWDENLQRIKVTKRN